MTEKEIMDWLEQKKTQSSEQGCPVVAGIKKGAEILWETNEIEMEFATQFPEEIVKRSEFFYRHVKHAEIKLIGKLKKEGISLAGQTVFVTLLPCPECLKVLIQERITEIFYREDHSDRNWSKRSHEKIKVTGIKLTQV
jgi:deoxycytidylate deaminase